MENVIPIPEQRRRRIVRRKLAAPVIDLQSARAARAARFYRAEQEYHEEVGDIVDRIEAFLDRADELEIAHQKRLAARQQGRQ